MGKIPKICRQNNKDGSVLLFVSIPVSGSAGKYKRKYFGVEGTQETVQAIAEFKKEWYRNDGLVSIQPKKAVESCSIAYLCTEFLKWTQTEYGKKSQEPKKFAIILSYFVSACGDIPCSEFGLMEFEQYQQTMIDSGRLCRKEINARITRIKRVFKWGARRRLVSTETNSEVQLLESIRIGKKQTFDNPVVTPVPVEDVLKTLPFLSTPVASMVRLQLLTGARPEEIRIMRPCDIDRTQRNGCWIYRPEHDKSQRFRQVGEKKEIPLNSEAQRIVEIQSMDLQNDSTKFIFRPSVAIAEQKATRAKNRKTKPSPSHIKRLKSESKQKLNDHYDAYSYRRAIARAAKKAGVPHWFPYQLRHTTATEVQRRFGIDAAKALLGHRAVTTTLIYVDPDKEEARKIASKLSLNREETGV